MSQGKPGGRPRGPATVPWDGGRVTIYQGREILREVLASLARVGQVSHDVQLLGEALLPRAQARGRHKGEKVREFLAALETGPVDEATAAARWGWNRLAAKRACYRMHHGPADRRAWVVFAGGRYTLLGRGPQPPRGWRGVEKQAEM